MRSNKRWILILFMAIIPIIGIWALNNPSIMAKTFLNLGGIKEGEAFPTVKGEEVSGESFVLASGKGKPHVVMIARIDCEVCQSTYPTLEKNKDLLRNANFVMIGKGGKEEYLQVKTEHNFSFPIVYADEQIQKDLKIKVFPTFYFIDKEGKIYKRLDGFDKDEFIKTLKEMKKG
ncbi:TlpA family protein disulfide reductase [Neobacillus cucumis]|uniref:TlpA family protein disulfide reductase n=1 Tax=Neobacillus cucumis TaxID=1740721 RepID=UPI001965ABB6|nr:TlpA disulfide reductase family protein [Neobacillus cucumis]MBM7652792.1 thioredoxin-related protein [Neobacillus cucumis]